LSEQGLQAPERGPKARTAAFFDLDGTLLTVNSADLWVKRERRLGRITRWQLARAGLWLGGYKLGFLDMESALREALGTLAGKEEAEIRAETQAWWREEVRPRVAPGARAVLEEHRQKGDLLVLLTSSSRYASEMALEEFGLDHALCQLYEVKEGRFTGEPLKPICYGPGKVQVAQAWALERGVDLSQSAFYSDSSTDVPMLEKVKYPFAVNPDPRLRLAARQRGWQVLDWSR
jgi:HAD superfamily hydrolase (TIGR01490 family)